jgi:hypothetical protein
MKFFLVLTKTIQDGIPGYLEYPAANLGIILQSIYLFVNFQEYILFNVPGNLRIAYPFSYVWLQFAAKNFQH